MMNPPRILILGKNGQVGWELCRALSVLGPIVALDQPDIDLADGASLQRCVQTARPDLILNAAAYTSVDRAEREPDLARQVNGIAPGILAEAARRQGAFLVHYSTDYVFDGQAQCPYTEREEPHPQNVYGQTKLAGEQAVQSIGGRHLIFRLCWVYGLRGRNFLLTVMRLLRERDSVRIVADQWGSPTWSRMIAEATAHAVRQTLAAAEPDAYCGLYHLSAAGSTSWHGFAQAVADAMPSAEKRCQRVEAISTAEYPTPAKRPPYSVLACEKFTQTFNLHLPAWDESLKLALDSTP